MKINNTSPRAVQSFSQSDASNPVQSQSGTVSESRFEKASSPAAQAVSQSAQTGGLGQILGKIAQGAKNVAVGAVMVGAAVGLTGCGQAPAPSPGLDVSFSLRDGVQVKGEAPDHAEFRIKAHTLANENYLGVKWGMFAHHAGRDLSMDKSELISLMNNAGADAKNLNTARGADLASDLLRMVRRSASPEDVKNHWAGRIIDTHDANADQNLSWAEFKPLLEIPR